MRPTYDSYSQTPTDEQYEEAKRRLLEDLDADTLHDDLIDEFRSDIDGMIRKMFDEREDMRECVFRLHDDDIEELAYQVMVEEGNAD